MYPSFLVALAVVLATGCGGSGDGDAFGSDPDIWGSYSDAGAGGGDLAPGVMDPASAVGGQDNTFSHPESLGGPSMSSREVLERQQAEGPEAFTSRVHACRKMRYQTMGRVLASLGVDLAATDELDPGRMWRQADQALGAPNYGARIPETTELTVSSTSRLFDILVQAAPVIITNMPSASRCSLGGVGARLFEADGTCRSDGLACLLGTAASPAHVALCNETVRRANDPDEGRLIAVASLLAASMTCE